MNYFACFGAHPFGREANHSVIHLNLDFKYKNKEDSLNHLDFLVPSITVGDAFGHGARD